MALDFPSSPTNNQVYENYIYSASSGAWQKLPGNTFATTAISDTPPINPANGDLWWNSADGQFYVYYNDGSSAQWVSASMPSVAVSDTPPAGYEGQLWLDSTDGSMYVYYTDPGGASSSWIGAVSRSGGILQVVGTTKTDSFTATGVTGTDYDVTGFSATITPSSTSSKILVMITMHASTQNNVYLEARLKRNGIVIAGHDDGEGASIAFVGLESAYGISESSLNYIDSPTTTSTLTYQLSVRQVASSSNTAIYVNKSSNNAIHGSSTITLVEVAG